jgi:hypothetical protein
MRDFLLPVLSFLAGLLALFFDSKDKKNRRLFVGALLVVAIGTSWYNLHESNSRRAQQEAEVKNQKDRADREQAQSDKLLTIVGELSSKVNVVKAMLESFGFTSKDAAAATPQAVGNAFQADARYAQFVQSAKQYPTVNVEYYAKAVDADTVKAAIEKLGLRVNVVDQPKNQTPTNRIWVGPEVPDDAVKFVAVTLIRAGAKIVDFRRIPSPFGDRASRIQIGAEPAIAGKPAMTLEDVEAFRNAALK